MLSDNFSAIMCLYFGTEVNQSPRIMQNKNKSLPVGSLFSETFRAYIKLAAEIVFCCPGFVEGFECAISFYPVSWFLLVQIQIRNLEFFWNYIRLPYDFFEFELALDINRCRCFHACLEIPDFIPCFIQAEKLSVPIPKITRQKQLFICW